MMRITRGPYAGYDPQTQRDIIARSSVTTNQIADETLLSAVNLRLDYTAGQLRISTDPPDLRLENQCEHCHRFDLIERVAYSWDEAIDFGWLIPVEENA